jgi:hypothetical protein
MPTPTRPLRLFAAALFALALAACGGHADDTGSPTAAATAASAAATSSTKAAQNDDIHYAP